MCVGHAADTVRAIAPVLPPAQATLVTVPVTLHGGMLVVYTCPLFITAVTSPTPSLANAAGRPVTLPILTDVVVPVGATAVKQTEKMAVPSGTVTPNGAVLSSHIKRMVPAAMVGVATKLGPLTVD